MSFSHSELMNKLYDQIAKYQGYFLGIALFLIFSAVSITVSKDETTLVLAKYPKFIFLLVVVGILVGLVYIRIDQRRIKELSKAISESYKEERTSFEKLRSTLTSRQVCDLIISGKSNKEIMSLLFIEQSTLKTHINQLYKKLKIKNRKELKSAAKS